MSKFIMITLFVLSSNLFAASFEHVIPTNISINEAKWDTSLNGIVVIEFDSIGTDISCTNDKSAAFTMSTPGADAMLQLAIHAFENRQPLQIYTNGCFNWNTSTNVVPKLEQIRVYR